MQESVPVGAAEGRPLHRATAASTGGPGSALDDPRALQILSTEHWSLLSSRSLAYNEAFSRAGMIGMRVHVAQQARAESRFPTPD